MNGQVFKVGTNNKVLFIIKLSILEAFIVVHKENKV